MYIAHVLPFSIFRWIRFYNRTDSMFVCSEEHPFGNRLYNIKTDFPAQPSRSSTTLDFISLGLRV